MNPPRKIIASDLLETTVAKGDNERLRLEPRGETMKMLALMILGVGLFAFQNASRPKTSASGLPGKWSYPQARKADVVEDYHGTKVPDPYRWLEDPDSPETRAWVEAENRLTREYLDATPLRGEIEARLTALWDYPKYEPPQKKGGRYFFSKNDGLQNQAVLYMVQSLEGEPIEILDPNRLSEDGTAAVTNRAFSEDGKLLAYGLSHSGSDWQEIRIRRVDEGEDFDDVIQWAKFAGIAWKQDNSGFFYNRFPTPGTVPPEDQNNYSRVYWHALGSSQEKDVLVFEIPEQKELGFQPFITDDGTYLVLFVFHGTDERNGIYVRNVESSGEFVRLLEVGESKYQPVGSEGSIFYFLTDLDAPRGRIIAIDLENADRKQWVTILPEGPDVIGSASIVNHQLVIQFLHNAHEKLSVYSLKGEFLNEIELPAMGSIAGITGEPDHTEMFFAFTSFVYPTTIYRYDFEKRMLEPFRQSEIDFDPSAYETKQVFYPSKDGTEVSMFLTHRRDLEPNGDHPTLLYGYGGFNISMTPSFSVSRLVWLERGGVYAQANLRGGSEYGEEWHRAGMLERKQNVFDDFIAAGEWLIDAKYTRRERLGIMGGSNGGLLVTACMLQRPDLFGAVVAAVPVTDMLRYHRWTVGRYWVPEYGNAEENPEHFRFLYAYSPLHNVASGQTYPPTLVTTADTDDRVVPAHGKKFVAALQVADSGKNPILLRVETKAGHGGGKPTSKLIEEAADVYAFLFRNLAGE
jgi:prolyl oligopeptidase